MNLRLKLFTLAMISLSFPAISSVEKPTESPAQVADPKFGLSIENPVEVCKPQGQREYLSRLVCPSGENPSFSRIGSVGGRNPLPDNMTDEQLMKMFQADMAGEELKEGEVDYHIVDSYEVICGEDKTVAYLDMYHCGKEPPTTPIEGFTIGE